MSLQALDNFDNIQWYKNEEVNNLLNYRIPRNRVLETFKRVDKLPFSNLNIRFSDNLWDFYSLCDLPISSHLYRFNFNSNSSFSEYLKFYVLNYIFKKTLKLRTLNRKFANINNFLNYVEAKGYKTIEIIPKKVYEDYFNQLEISYLTSLQYKQDVLSFIDFFEFNFKKINDNSINTFLKEKNDAKRKAIKESNKTPEIPIEYLSKLVSYCKKLMLDENEDEQERCTAAIIILYSQIGFRTGELLTIKANSLKEELSPNFDEPLRYLTYKSYKHGKGESQGSEGVTVINDLSYLAYKVLQELCEPYRSKINSDCLIVGKYQTRKVMTASRMAIRLRNFYFMHNKHLPCINTQEDFPELVTTPLSTFLQKNNNGYCRYDLSKDSYMGINENDVLVYPSIHMFRVTVCTTLYRQEVPLYYIKKHMNHLSEDMTAYYIRPEKNIQKDYSKKMYNALIKDKSTLLGKYSDEFTKKIESYIQNLDVNLKKNVDEVIEMVANKYPLREKVGGMCIRCGEVVPCASSDSTDQIYCSFGMCPNHCHMFFMADISYNEYLNHKKIIEYNKSNGFVKATQKEINKIKYVIENSLKPELDELRKEIDRNGSDTIKSKYPQLSYVVDNFDDIYKEMSKWLMKK